MSKKVGRPKKYTKKEEIEEKIATLDRDKEEAIRVQDFEKAATLRDKENEQKDKLEKEKKRIASSVS